MTNRGPPDLKNEEDRELEIIHELAEKVLPFSGAISEACDICAELDCLLCFAEATNQYNYRRPQMSEENVVNIKQGRYGAFSVIPQYSFGTQSPIVFFFFFLVCYIYNKASTAGTNRRHVRTKRHPPGRRSGNWVMPGCSR
jgi:hypothetical protein